MQHNFEDLIDSEMKIRKDLEDMIMNIVFSKFRPIKKSELGKGKGHKGRGVKRGTVQKLIFKELGFVGTPPNYFANYINRLMLKNGFIATYRTGFHIYRGIKEKDVEI